MSFENPTRLRIGMHGNFAGKDYRLIGRVVMGVTDDGETYYWNEFNLECKDGTSADLVYEETERGGEWRLFTLFDPEYPMTAADAATKRVGDRLNLTGTDVRVTLVDSSLVYHIEGQAPEGVEVGDEANYFNAEAGSIMQVVSWTGEEVEFYNGMNLASGVVNAAFNLPPEPSGFSGNKIFSSLSGSGSGNYNSGVKFGLQAAFVLFLFFIIFGRTLSCSTDYEASPVKKISAGTSPLTIGASGKLNDKHYRVTGHAVVEIAEVGLDFERHEYQLTDDDGITDLLVCGLKPGEKNWTLFTPLAPLLPPSAKECAAKKIGEMVNVDGVDGPVREIFLSTFRQPEAGAAVDPQNGNPWFGYLAQSEYSLLLVRWNSRIISFQRGKNVAVKDATAAFASLPGK
jgi:hypothetical protein